MNKKRILTLIVFLFVFMLAPMKVDAANYKYVRGKKETDSKIISYLGQQSLPAKIELYRNSTINGVTRDSLEININKLEYEDYKIISKMLAQMTSSKYINGPIALYLYDNDEGGEAHIQFYGDFIDYLICDSRDVYIGANSTHYKGLYLNAWNIEYSEITGLKVTADEVIIDGAFEKDLLTKFTISDNTTFDVIPRYEQKIIVPAFPKDVRNAKITIRANTIRSDGFVYIAQKYCDGSLLSEKNVTPGMIVYQSSEDVANNQLYKSKTIDILEKCATYKCPLNANGGTVSSNSISVTYNNKLPAFPTPTRKGYTFTGWYLNDNMVVQSDFVYEYTTPKTFVAHWKPNKYKVTLDYADGKTKPFVFEATFDQPYATLPVPIREGYTFTGWLAPDKVIVNRDTIVTVAGNHTLTATWKTYSVTVKAKKVKGAKGYEFKICSNKKFKAKKGSDTFLDKKTAKKNKYKFTGIQKKGIYYYKYRSYKKQKGKKVYSKWSKIKKVTVK